MIGNSVAYHLVQRGWSDIVVIDKGSVASGTSKHGSGMLGLFRPQHEWYQQAWLWDVRTVQT